MAATGGTGDTTGVDAELEIIPLSLRSRLDDWIDLRQIGLNGFWAWLETVLPALPGPSSDGRRTGRPGVLPGDRVRELATDLVTCASDRARLTTTCEQYFRDNQALSRRIKALEASLRIAQTRRGATLVRDDPKATDAAERYLPGGKT